jgi:ATP adenylyltransferase
MSPKPLWAPWRLEYVQHADELDRCIFCDPEPELLVATDDDALVVLNRFPYASGHLLVAPRRHLGDLGALSEGEALAIHRFSVRAVEALRSVYAAQGFNLGWNLGRIAGAGIEDHIHLHVVPRWNGDTSFMAVLGDVKVIPDALDATREKLEAVF